MVLNSAIKDRKLKYCTYYMEFCLTFTNIFILTDYSKKLKYFYCEIPHDYKSFLHKNAKLQLIPKKETNEKKRFLWLIFNYLYL